MLHRYLSLALLLLVVYACGPDPKSDVVPQKPGPSLSLPDTKVASQLPAFAKQENEVEIADSMNDVDPTWVLGSIVTLETGRVRGLDNYLGKDAKPVMTPQTEVIFKDFIENSLATKVAWLDFLQAQLSDKVRAELSVIKTSKVTMKNTDVDTKRLSAEAQQIPKADRTKYGVIIGYIDFVLSASLFRDSGAEAAASGYGAKIGGSWFAKAENTTAHHRVIAIWSPLPFVVEAASKRAPTDTDLVKETLKALREGTLNFRKIERAYIEPRRLPTG